MARPNLADQTRARIVSTAIALADEHGIDALSVRALGAALGMRGATLYHYFPSKEALLDSVARRIGAEMGGAVESRLADVAAGDWEEMLRGFVEAATATLGQHPRLVGFFALRPVSSEGGALAAYESMLRRLTACGWPLGFAWQAYLATENLMLSAALEAGVPLLRPDPGLLDGLPLMTELVGMLKQDPALDEGAGFGLDALIAGIGEAASRLSS